MSKWQEDLIYGIAVSVKDLKLEKQFTKQLKIMSKQPQHEYKTIGELYEYAFAKITAVR